MRSEHVATIAGITYRQLDHLTRTAQIGTNPGSGRHRHWTLDDTARITIAAQLNSALPAPTRSASSLPALATAIAALPHPPPLAGWAWYTPDPLTAGYTADIRVLVDQLEQTGAAVMVAYDLADAFGPDAHLLNDLAAA
jgi:hypothetical protein